MDLTVAVTPKAMTLRVDDEPVTSPVFRVRLVRYFFAQYLNMTNEII